MTGYCEECEVLRPFELVRRADQRIADNRQAMSTGGNAQRVKFEECGHRTTLVVGRLAS